MRALLLVAALASGSAHAACPAMDAAEFERIVADAQIAIDDDDLMRHGTIFRGLQERVLCLDDVVPVDAWADFLVGYAVVEFAMGREWQAALDVALSIRPTVSREYGPLELRNYVPTALHEDADAPLLPADAEIYLNGRPIQREPELHGLNIVQQRKNGVLNTRVLLNQPFPEAWREQFVEPEAPELRPLHVAVFVQGGLAVGGQAATEGAADARIPDLSGAGALLSLGSFGTWAPGAVGVFWDATGPFRLGEGPGVEAWLGPAVRVADGVFVEPGGGVVSVWITDVNGPRPVVLPQGHLAGEAIVPVGDALDLEIGLGGGLGLNGWHGRLRAGVCGGGAVGWNAGIDATTVTALFDEEGSDRRVAASARRFGLRGGVSFR